VKKILFDNYCEKNIIVKKMSYQLELKLAGITQVLACCFSSGYLRKIK